MSRISIHVEAAIDENVSNVSNFIKHWICPKFYKAPFYDSLPELYNKNNITIFAGYETGPEGISIINCNLHLLSEYILKNYTTDSKIIFDNSTEGGAGLIFARLHEIAKITNIPSNRIILINSLCNNKSIYDEFCIDNNIQVQDRIQVYGFNPFHVIAKANINLLPPINFDNLSLHRNKTYLCFNRVLRPHRLFLLSLILQRKLLDSGYYSFFSYFYNTESTGNIALRSNINSIFDMYMNVFGTELVDQLKQIYWKNENLLPLKLDIDAINNKNYIYIDNSNSVYYEDSLLSLVTETFAFENGMDYMGYKCIEGKGIFFSEKIFKPIVMCHPFILVSRPKSLYYLRKMGYETFSPYINEDYDNIVNDKDRLIAIVDEVQRINSLTDSEKMEWLKNVLQIAFRNYTILKNKNLSDFDINNLD